MNRITISVILVIIFLCIIWKWKFKNTINEYFEAKKISFCFLIYDKIHNENIWKSFFENVDSQKYNIYIHYKENKPLKYFEQYKITNTVPTEWCGTSLINAQNVLLTNAISDINNQHFIFLSGSCIPLKSFDTIYNTLSTSKSYFNERVSRINYVTNNIKAHKASQWCILNRKHTELILNNQAIIESMFNKFVDITKAMSFGCPDEFIYISLLKHLNMANELDITSDLSANATTFTGWNDAGNYRDFSDSIKSGQPNNYTKLSKNELDYLVNSRSLFGRKFTDGCKGLYELIPIVKG